MCHNLSTFPCAHQAPSHACTPLSFFNCTQIFEMSAKKRDRCLQEVTLLQQLDHPNIIQMLDAFIDENMLIIIFEWAPAGDLKRLIKKTAEQGKTLDEPSIWTLFYQVGARGLRVQGGWC